MSPWIELGGRTQMTALSPFRVALTLRSGVIPIFMVDIGNQTQGCSLNDRMSASFIVVAPR